jgi:hypothetical protein
VKVSALLGLVLLASCGTPWDGDPELWGMALEVRPTQQNAAWVERDDLKPRVHAAVEQSAAYWGIAPHDLAGWRLLLTEGLLHCGSHTTANGCTTTGDRTIAITANYYVCIESSTLMHEIGHVALGGDSHHEDPRWHDDDAIKSLWQRMHGGLLPAPDCGGEPYTGQWQGF